AVSSRPGAAREKSQKSLCIVVVPPIAGERECDTVVARWGGVRRRARSMPYLVDCPAQHKKQPSKHRQKPRGGSGRTFVPAMFLTTVRFLDERLHVKWRRVVKGRYQCPREK